MTLRMVPNESLGFEAKVSIPWESDADRLAYIKRTEDDGLYLFTSPELFPSGSNDPSFILAQEAIRHERDHGEVLGPYFPVPSSCHFIAGHYHKNPSVEGKEWFKTILVPIAPGERKSVLDPVSDEERVALDELVVDHFPDHVRFL